MSPRPRVRTRRQLVVGAIAASALLLAACGADQGVNTLGASPTREEPEPAPEPTTDPSPAPANPTDPTTPTNPTTPTDPTLPPIVQPSITVEIPITDVVDVGSGKPARAHDAFVAVAFTDIERWWSEAYPAVYGEPFEPLTGGLYAGYPGRDPEIPGCGEPETRYEDLTLYVAFYCEFGDFMAYDDGTDGILTPLAEDIGNAVMGVVLAHEYGHLIQERSGALDRPLPTIITEQQADCFAGGWTGQSYRGESDLLQLGDADVRAGLIAMLSVRDPVGTDQFAVGGHGSAFDRVGAFQEGFINGPARCAELLDDPLELMPNAFQPFSVDEQLGGNAPYFCTELPADLQPDCTPAPEFLATDLNEFWSLTASLDFPVLTAVPLDGLGSFSCEQMVALAPEVVYCPTNSTVVFDEPAVLSLYREFGDFTLGYFYGIAWAEAAQQVLGSPLTGEDRALANDCFTGAWVRDITPAATGVDTRPDSDVVSSPGDLDEAIRMAILIGDQGANVDTVGTPFEKIGSFRSGVLGGLPACEALLPG